MNVFLSKYNWTPAYRGRGSQFLWDIGEIVNVRSEKDPTKIYRVTIDSRLMKHDDATGNGYVYEVIFEDGSGRWAIKADLIEPADEDEIARGRASLGLSPIGTADERDVDRETPK